MKLTPSEAKAYNRMESRLLPAIPVCCSLFQRGYSYHAANVESWEWSDTFGKWGAIVVFTSDNHRCYTFPKPEPRKFR